MSSSCNQFLGRQYSFHFFIVIFASLGIIGCATSDALRKEERASLKAVTLSENVHLPEEMVYIGNENMAGRVIFGAFGYLAAQDEMKKSSDYIKETMVKSDIDVGKIVFDKFSDKLKKANIFDEISSGCSDCPRFSLSIQVYGLAQIHGYSSQLKPMLNVEGVLTDPNKTVLWKKTSYVTNLSNKTPPNTLEEYLQEPELLRIAFSIASEIVTTDLIKHIQED